MVFRTPVVLLLASIAASPAMAFHRIPGVKRMNEPSWKPPMQTNAPDPTTVMEQGTSPRPTDAPEFGAMELVKRNEQFVLSSDTCGYIAGFWGRSLAAAQTISDAVVLTILDSSKLIHLR